MTCSPGLRPVSGTRVRLERPAVPNTPNLIFDAAEEYWTLSEALRIYLNRLSDLLFVLARVLARHAQGGEVLWDRARLE